MDFVVDANVLFSALIRDGVTSGLLFEDNFHLYSAEYIFLEIEEHKEELLKKTKRDKNDFLRLLEIFRKKFTLIPLEELVPYIERAENISPDPDDVIYVAIALKMNIPIWSNDSDLKNKQDIIKVYNTTEVMKLTKFSST